MKEFENYIEKKYANNTNYFSILKLLPYALMDRDNKNALDFLKKAESENKKIVAYYPALDKINLSDYEVIGTIWDGLLLIQI